MKGLKYLQQFIISKILPQNGKKNAPAHLTLTNITINIHKKTFSFKILTSVHSQWCMCDLCSFCDVYYSFSIVTKCFTVWNVSKDKLPHLPCYINMKYSYFSLNVTCLCICITNEFYQIVYSSHRYSMLAQYSIYKKKCFPALLLLLYWENIKC